MIRLPKVLDAWQTPAFKEVFEQEVGALDRSLLPLQPGLSHGSHIADEAIGVMLLSAVDAGSSVQVRAGIFFSSIIAGCSCADDPTPVDRNSEYCELQFDIDKRSADTQVRCC
ncbi:MAG: hypothetical protein KDI49_07015 [Gammaproteobacteria bacterium]|nr:hypothetical protein [Gammaproteobacteria bacterium]MCB1880659.1 hypothetical protein [Gammaproteobacteria bacterium]